ncbi:MAG TPA: MmcQ/YjbR family DNA-binding protein [Vicinamibacterales bacterium]|nr:MmcQ/YjbR family DNA-binding protein [Vicinamibacterales bacterium]
MPRRETITFDTVLTLGLELPGVEAATSWGAPALKVDGRMFACKAIHKSAEPDTLVVRMDVDERDELIAADPRTYYLKEHYVDYACVLVRLSRVDREALRGLLLMGWGFVSRGSPARARSRRQPRAAPRHGR